MDLQAQSVLNSTTIPTRQNQSTRSFIESEVAKHQVVIFAKTWCPYCNRTEALFESDAFKNVDIRVFDLDIMENGDSIQGELYKMTGQATVPSVWINGIFLGGNSETQAAWRMGHLSSMIDTKGQQ